MYSKEIYTKAYFLYARILIDEYYKKDKELYIKDKEYNSFKE